MTFNPRAGNGTPFPGLPQGYTIVVTDRGTHYDFASLHVASGDRGPARSSHEEAAADAREHRRGKIAQARQDAYAGYAEPWGL